MLLPNNVVSLQINVIIFVVLLRVIFAKISIKYHSNHVQKAKWVKYFSFILALEISFRFSIRLEDQFPVQF